jgi:hypothetical protein
MHGCAIPRIPGSNGAAHSYCRTRRCILAEWGRQRFGGADVPAERRLTDLENTLARARGEILLKRDRANTAPAEDAFLAAIAIAQQQKARSFELRAALSLAKLYHSTDRPADAHAVLASPLKRFSPTPEFPEIAEAQSFSPR